MKVVNPSNIAGVSVVSIGEKSVTFKFIDNEKNDKKGIVGNKFTVPFKEFPDNLQDVTMKDGAKVFVAFNNRGEILQFRPANGNAVVKFKSLSKNENGYWVDVRDGSWHGNPTGKEARFSAELVIVEGRYVGCIVPQYLFAMRYDKPLLVNIEGSMAIQGNTQKGVAKDLFEFFTRAGIADEDIDFPDDDDIQEVLAVIDSRLRKAAKTGVKFGITLEDGYIKSMYKLDEVDAFKDDEEEKEANKPAKNSKYVKEDNEDEEDLR